MIEVYNSLSDIDNDRKARMDAFIKELDELSRKYEVYIWGSGDAGSPALQDAKNYKGYDIPVFMAECLYYEDEENGITHHYTTDEYESVIPYQNTCLY